VVLAPVICSRATNTRGSGGGDGTRNRDTKRSATRGASAQRVRTFSAESLEYQLRARGAVAEFFFSTEFAIDHSRV